MYQIKTDFDFRKEAVLSNALINTKSLNSEKVFMSDTAGILRFSPGLDFDFNEFRTNDTIEFHFRFNQKEFSNFLKWTPSEWMDQYARIKVPKTEIFTDNYNRNIGFAREGMLYRVMDQSLGKIKIQAGSMVGWIPDSTATLYYTRNIKTDLSPAIKGYVTEEMQKWMQQGEFELPDEYLNRIAGKDKQLLIFTNEAMITFQKEYVKTFEWEKSSISNYDPNSQTFKISIPQLDDFVIHVPIQYARDFKTNWNTGVVFRNQEFLMVDGQWKLISFGLEDKKQHYVAEYNSNMKNTYDPVNQFAFNLKDFEPDLSKFNSYVTQKPIKVVDDKEKYPINTNLPGTIMKQPDAIAVVIGNALYQKTDNVNFAINDAQLMKLYLTEVLGFKEGNIIFLMNAGKAEFDGLFGTENNYRGRLYNYIKPDISDVFIFYSGHGAPDPQTAEPYFVPSDCDPAYLTLQGYALKTLYANLAKLPSKSTTIIIDACFSGAGVLKNISSVRIKPKETEEDIKNSAILSSSKGEQVSSWYSEMRHGLFTYFFLKSIHDHANSDKNQDGRLTFQEIFDYISDKTNGLPYLARRLNAVDQTPVIKGNNPERVFVKFTE